MNKLLKYTLGVLGYILISVAPVGAVVPSDAVFIQDLPEYINYQALKVTYTAFSNNPVTAKFFYKKDGDAGWTEFTTVNGYNGEVQFGGTQINEQKKYFFKVEINGGTAVDETSTFYDASGPSPVNSYSKEKVSDGFYRLHWKNPADTDFSRVFIYRSDNSNFTADDSTKVAEKGGAPDTEQTWDNPGLDTSKTYYYAIRAIDKAGNPSSIVADADTTVQVLGVAATSGIASTTGSGKVISLPKEGEVLSGEDKEGDSASEAAKDSETKGLMDTVKDMGYAKVGIIALLILGLGAIAVSFLKREKK